MGYERAVVETACSMEAREVNLTLDFCIRVGELLIASGTGAAECHCSRCGLYGLTPHAQLASVATILSTRCWA